MIRLPITSSASSMSSLNCCAVSAGTAAPSGRNGLAGAQYGLLFGFQDEDVAEALALQGKVLDNTRCQSLESVGISRNRAVLHGESSELDLLGLAQFLFFCEVQFILFFIRQERDHDADPLLT